MRKIRQIIKYIASVYARVFKRKARAKIQAKTVQIEPRERREIAPVKNKRNSLLRKYGKIGRNASCPCGSEKKYKHCCLTNVSLKKQYIQKDKKQ